MAASALNFTLYFQVVNSDCTILSRELARSKTRKPRKSWKSWKLFSKIFKSEFSILPYSQNRKLGNKKTRNNDSEISKISGISEFSICHFFIFQKSFFQYSKVFKILPCRIKVYLLWDVSTPFLFIRILFIRIMRLKIAQKLRIL